MDRLVKKTHKTMTRGAGSAWLNWSAAQKLNSDEQRPVYGLVTDAEVWQFGKLEASRFTKHRTHITVDDVPNICRALLYCLKDSWNPTSVA